jgi:serine/threonine protein kinase
MTSEYSGSRHSLFRGLGTGSRLAGYLIQEQIGTGGMAVVFRARDEVLGRLAAVKVIAPSLAGDEEFRTRFLRESRAAAAVDSLHIVPVYGAGEAEGLLYIATRFVAGGDLAALARRAGGRLAPERVVPLVAQVASALDAAHAAGLVHRDVKPHNILIDAMPERPEHAYLSDFGLSKTTASTGLTASGEFLGTPDYCAPEQVRSARVDGRADQYALGCVAFALLTGAAPFHREETLATLFAHVQDPVPSVAGLRPELPPAVDAVIARALAKSPDGRYASCGEFAAALQEALAPDHPVTVTGPLPRSAGDGRSAGGPRPVRAGGRDAAAPAAAPDTPAAAGAGTGYADTITPGNGSAGRQDSSRSARNANPEHAGVPGYVKYPRGAGHSAKAPSRRALTVAGGVALLAVAAVVAVLTLIPGYSHPSAASTGNAQQTHSSALTEMTGSPAPTPEVSAGTPVVPSHTSKASAAVTAPTAGTGKKAPPSSPTVQHSSPTVRHSSPTVQTVASQNTSSGATTVQSSSAVVVSSTTTAPASPTVSAETADPGTCGGRTCYHFSVSVASFPGSTVLSYSCSEAGGSIDPSGFTGTQVISGSTTTNGSGSTNWVTECEAAFGTTASVTITVSGGGQSASASAALP